jgi:hypothetical protein
MGYFKTQTDGSRVWIEDDGKSHSLIEVVTGAQTLTVEDSGKTFILRAAAGAAIALPAVTAAIGFKAKFITGLAFATTNFTIVSTTNVIQGGAIVNSTYVPAVNENTISFVATAETVGDVIELECDGTNWYANGVGALAGSITFTAP